jgi:hypothetical protein
VIWSVPTTLHTDSAGIPAFQLGIAHPEVLRYEKYIVTVTVSDS